MGFPIQRLRRLRQHESLRRMVRETTLSPSDFIYPLFVVEGQDRCEEIASMVIKCRISDDLLVNEAGVNQVISIPVIMLFSIPMHKDDSGSSGSNPNGIVQRPIRTVKQQMPGLLVITDVCIDE